MPQLKTKALILAKIQTTLGADAAPTAAANAILVGSPDINPVTRKLERKNIKPYLGAPQVVTLGEGMSVKFNTEMRGSGAAGTPPEIGPLYRACGYTETINAAVSVVYTPNSAIVNGEYLTIWYWLDGMLYKIIDCVGTFSVDLKAGEYGLINWEFTGTYAGPSDAPIQSGAYNATIPPRFLSATFTLDTFAAIIETLKITQGNLIGKRPSANAPTGVLSYFIKERTTTMETDPEVPDALNAGAIKTLSPTPTAGGTGYSADDILTITTGGTLATAKVLTVNAGVVTSVQLITKGQNYTTGTGKVTSGGGGTGCTLNITALETVYKNFWTLLDQSTLFAVAANVGSIAGNICAIAAPKAQITDLKYADRDSLATHSLPMNLCPNAGNDELTFTFT